MVELREITEGFKACIGLFNYITSAERRDLSYSTRIRSVHTIAHDAVLWQ